MFVQGHIDPFWKEEFKNLNYYSNPFYDSSYNSLWIKQGYVVKKFFGEMFVASAADDCWTTKFFTVFDGSNVGVTFYKMQTSTVMPMHKDTFNFYVNKYNIKTKDNIKRTLIFLEDWKSGHIFEIKDTAITGWKAGDFVSWDHTTYHMAANIGVETRYTVQITYTDV